RTRHSRPPDDLASVWFCSLVVATALWGWLVADEGLHRHRVLVDALAEAEAPSARTVQRWLRRALAHADETATALRRAVIERSEPRPIRVARLADGIGRLASATDNDDSKASNKLSRS